MVLNVTASSIFGGTIIYACIHVNMLILKKLVSMGMKETERVIAIRNHYKKRVRKQGHELRSVIDCDIGKCQLL